MSDHLETEHARAWIGRQESEADTVTTELLKRFTATLSGYTHLSNTPERQLPLGIHWCLAQNAVPVSGLGADGHPANGGFLPPAPLPYRMWAAGKIRFHATPNVGTPIARTSTIADVVEKHSSISGPLVFVHVDHVYTQHSAGSEITLIEERQTLVYRQSSSFKKPSSQAQPTSQHSAATLSLNITPDSTLLFRYSALTFNGHRIHYDHNYATQKEGYPGLVVHGPLMATLLMNLAQASRPDSVLQEFEFKGVAPAFVDQALQLVVQDKDAKSLEVRNREGAPIMTAKATYAHRDDR